MVCSAAASVWYKGKVRVGRVPASQVYVGNKRKACEQAGILSLSYDLPEDTSQAALEALAEPTDPLFYVGGSPSMAWAVFDDLIAEGVPAKNIHSDVFDYAPR